MRNNSVSKRSKKNNKNNKNNNNKKKITKKKGPILEILGPKKKCNYLDLDCLFNVKRTTPKKSDLFYENMGQLIDVDTNFDEKYYTKCKNLQTYNNSNNRLNKIDKLIKDKKGKSKKKGGWEILTLPKSLYTPKSKKKTCFRKDEDYPLNLDLGDQCFKDYQCKSSKCDSFNLFGFSTPGKCVEPIDMRSKKEGETCKEDKECKRHLVCKGSEDIGEKICILNKKYIAEIDNQSKFSEVDRDKMNENMRWTHITPNFEQGAAIKFCKKDKDCQNGHCVSAEVSPETITKQHYSDDLRKKIFGEHVDKDISKTKKRKINICHKIGIKCDSTKNETCRNLGSTRSEEFRTNKCCGRNQMCENNLCIPLEDAKNIPINFNCKTSSQCKTKFCDPTSKLCKPRNSNYKQCKKNADCNSESKNCYDGSCIEIEEFPNNSIKGGDKCARSAQCIGTSKCRGYKTSKFIKQKNILGDTFGSTSHYNVCEQTPDQYKDEEKKKEKQAKSNKSINSAFVKIINKLQSELKSKNYVPNIIYSYNSDDSDEYKTVIVFDNNNYYLGKMTVDKNSNGKDSMTIYYFTDEKVNEENMESCGSKIELKKIQECPNKLLSNLKIITNSSNYFLKNGLKYQLFNNSNNNLETIVLKNIKTEKFSNKFNNFDGIIQYNGVTYNENKKIYEETIYKTKRNTLPNFLNIPNEYLYNLLVHMLFFDKFELTKDFIVDDFRRVAYSKPKKNITCDLQADENDNNIDEIENMNEVCNHFFGYIQHLPHKHFEDKNYKDEDYEDLSRFKLCGYELSNNEDCSQEFSNSKMQLFDIPYTLNYKCMFKKTEEYYQPKFESMKKFGSSSNNSRQYFIDVFKEWLTIVKTQKYTYLKDIHHDELFGEFEGIMNYNLKTKNSEKSILIKKKFENTNSNIYRKNILDTLKNLNHILVRDHDLSNLKTNIDFESVDFNRYCIISNLIKKGK